MKLVQLLVENIQRTAALKKQQELIDHGYDEVKVIKHGADYGNVYEIKCTGGDLDEDVDGSWFCTTDGDLTFFSQHMDTIEKNPMDAKRFAHITLNGRFPAGEKVIAESPSVAHYYAEDVIKGPWPPGEKAISSESGPAYYYAKDVIKGPWPPGEKVIAASGQAAYHYATNVLHGRFPAGEEAILACEYKQLYQMRFTKK